MSIKSGATLADVAILLALAAAAMLFGPGTGIAAPCGALVCLQGTAGAGADCRAQAQDDFTAAKNLCAERDPVCVTACGWRHEECRTLIGLVRGLDACNDQLRLSTVACVARYPHGSVRRSLCLDRARLTDARCRARVRRETRRDRRRCDREIVVCISACGPGSPPNGSVVCRAEAATRLKSALAGCAAITRGTRSACLDKDPSCVDDCREARDACDAPTRDTLTSALVACDAQEHADADACANDPSCLQAAEADGLVCRQAARTTAEPGLAACASAQLACARSCSAPANGTPTAGATAATNTRSTCTVGDHEVTR